VSYEQAALAHLESSFYDPHNFGPSHDELDGINEDEGSDGDGHANEEAGERH
jgi:hypothetical protein